MRKFVLRSRNSSCQNRLRNLGSLSLIIARGMPAILKTLSKNSLAYPTAFSSFWQGTKMINFLSLPMNTVEWFSARAPCDGSSIPRVVARLNRHGARRFLRHVADGGGPVSRTALPRCVFGRMVWVRRLLCARFAGRQRQQNRGVHYKVPRLLSPRHTAP